MQGNNWRMIPSAALLAIALLGCAKSPIPPAGTRVSTNSEVFRQAAQGLRDQCARLGCTCNLDGIETTCAVVFACLDAGFCELAKE